MKKITLLIAAFIFAVGVQAQTATNVDISFESAEGYVLDTLNGQNGWESGVTLAQVSADQASDGVWSFKLGVDQNNEIEEGYVAGAMKQLTTVVEQGQKNFSVDVYLPSDFLTDTQSSTQLHVIPGEIGTDGLTPLGQWIFLQGVLAVSLPQGLMDSGLTPVAGAWNTLVFHIDFDAQTYQVTLNGQEILDPNTNQPIDLPMTNTKVDGLIFYTDGTKDFYVDNIESSDGMGVEDFQQTEAFVHYVQNNQLHLESKSQIGEVAVYNLLGQQVASSVVNNTNGSLDLSNLTTGVYLAKVAVNGQAKSFKFLVK